MKNKPKMVSMKKQQQTSPAPVQQQVPPQKRQIVLPTDREEFFKIYGFYKEDVNILFATPCYGGLLYTSYFMSFINTIDLLKKLGIKSSIKNIVNESLITRARNTCVNMFLSDEQYTHLMFIDADISWEPYHIISMLSKKRPVISGVYPKKTYRFNILQEILKSNDEELKSWISVNTVPKLMDYVVNFEDGHTFKIEPDGKTIKVKDAPTGFMLIERETFNELIKKYPTMKYNNDLDSLDTKTHNPDKFYNFFDTMIDPRDGRYLSEDYAFCRLVQETGLGCYIDIDVKLDHTGTHTFAGNFKQSIVSNTK